MAKTTKNTKQLFGTEFNGFNKKQVTEYIESLEEQYKNSLKRKDKEFSALEESYKELKDKYTELFSGYKVLQDDKSRIADVLIGAENTAKGIVEQAKSEAVIEKLKIEEQAEALREVVVDRNKIIKDMTESINSMIADFEAQIKKITDDISNKLSESLAELNTNADLITEKSMAECESTSNNA